MSGAFGGTWGSSQWSVAAATIPAVAGLLAIGAVLSNLRRLRGTTLLAPALWMLVSLLALVTTESLLEAELLPSTSTWRYLSAITTLCPAVALLGAKRPQDRGWQFIVASLWIVLALPAAQNLAFSPDGQFELHAAWRWFLAILIGIGLANQLPTRFALSTLLLAVAQVLLLSKQLPVPITVDWQRYGFAAMPLIAIAAVIAWIQFGRIPRVGGWNRVWLDFRDQFGAVWALRVAERVNHAARLHEWPARLTWQGFSSTSTVHAEERLSAEMELSIRTLLRRFVSPGWIDTRLSADKVSEST